MKKRLISITLCLVILFAANLVLRSSFDGYIADADSSSSSTSTASAPPAISSSGGRYHPVTLSEQPENGTVFIDHRRAIHGEKIQITATPDPGYSIDSVTVTDAHGEAKTVTDNGDNSFTFQMPQTRVYIQVSFKEGSASSIFEDVDKTHVYYDAIQYVKENNLMTGISGNAFGPNILLTRAMVVTILYRANGEPDVSIENPFVDLPDESIYKKPILWAKSVGLVNGYSETVFGTGDFITRQQIAAILFRYAQFKGYDVSAFEETNILSYEDASDVAEYAIAPFQYVLGAGIFSGKSAPVLKPNEYVARGEFSEMLMRFIEVSK